nr:hypothetical protein [Tanacetum cinerariifolium]
MEDWITRVKILYKTHVGTEFKHKSAWLFLKDKHKWTNLKSKNARRNRFRVTDEELEHFGYDALPRPPGLQRIVKSQRSCSNSTASSGSNPMMYQEFMKQQYELDRKAKIEVIAQESKERRLLIHSQRIEEDMKVLQIDTRGMDPADAAIINAQKARIRAAYRPPPNVCHAKTTAKVFVMKQLKKSETLSAGQQRQICAGHRQRSKSASLTQMDKLHHHTEELEVDSRFCAHWTVKNLNWVDVFNAKYPPAIAKALTPSTACRWKMHYHPALPKTSVNQLRCNNIIHGLLLCSATIRIRPFEKTYVQISALWNMAESRSTDPKAKDKGNYQNLRSSRSNIARKFVKGQRSKVEQNESFNATTDSKAGECDMDV